MCKSKSKFMYSDDFNPVVHVNLKRAEWRIQLKSANDNVG